MRRFLLLLLVIGMAASCWHLAMQEREKAVLKQDRIELEHIKYGLFNVDEWKQVLAEIITKKVRELEVTDANRATMHAKVEEVLYKVLDALESDIRQKGSQSIAGFLQRMISDLVGVTDRMRGQVPEYADQVIDYLNDPRNREDLKDYLIARLNEMVDNTVGETDYTRFNAILATYGATDKAECIREIETRRSAIRQQEQLGFLLLAVCITGLVALLLTGRRGKAELTAMVAGAFILLVTGLALPMIDIEATISSFSFTLVGEPVTFTDQVLFFQTKSILQVVELLLRNGGFGLVVVGVLVLSFSVLLPVAKLTLSAISIARGSVPGGWLPHFLVYKSSKWSMADVMVVAIFMAYIGFNGVINSQLTQLKALSGDVELFTTNNSVLQAGFYFFTAYVIAGLLLSGAVGRRMREENPSS